MWQYVGTCWARYRFQGLKLNNTVTTPASMKCPVVSLTMKKLFIKWLIWRLILCSCPKHLTKNEHLNIVNLKLCAFQFMKMIVWIDSMAPIKQSKAKPCEYSLGFIVYPSHEWICPLYIGATANKLERKICMYPIVCHNQIPNEITVKYTRQSRLKVARKQCATTHYFACLRALVLNNHTSSQAPHF